jgi:hypothetical protein
VQVSLACTSPGCAREALCDACFKRSLTHLGGVAEHRGGLWAERVIRAGRDRSLPWWPYEDARVRELALQAIADFVGPDLRLREALSRACYDGAARTWTRGPLVPYGDGAGG